MEMSQIVLFLSFLFLICDGKKNRDLYCAVCRSVVDEINYSITGIDPRKKVQIGSFRVDPKGNQGTYEIPYARSEVHLTELLENVCERFNEYAETTLDNGKKSVVRTSSRSGKALNLKNIAINTEKQKLIRFACDTIIEDYEDELIHIFKKIEDPLLIEKKICGSRASFCSEADLNTPMPDSEIGDEDVPDEEEQDDEDDADEEVEEKDEL